MDENPETPMVFGICSIPTLLFFKNEKFVYRVIGFVPRQELETLGHLVDETTPGTIQKLLADLTRKLRVD